jgi:hypothetical protein
MTRNDEHLNPGLASIPFFGYRNRQSKKSVVNHAPEQARRIEVMSKEKGLFTLVCILFTCLAIALPALAQEKKKDIKPDKVWGMVVAGKPDPSGKFSSVALETQKKEVLPLMANDVVKKVEKLIGKGVEIQGKLKEVDGKKVLEVWTFVQKEKPDAPQKDKK